MGLYLGEAGLELVDAWFGNKSKEICSNHRRYQYLLQPVYLLAHPNHFEVITIHQIPTIFDKLVASSRHK